MVWDCSFQRVKSIRDNSEEDKSIIPVRMLDEFAYCARLFYLEMIHGEFEDSSDTIEGRFVHRNVDETNSGLLPSADNLDPSMKIKSKSVTMGSEKYGIISKIDLVENQGDEIYPVEFKKGKAPEDGTGVWLSDKIQICAQILILRENGYKCSHGEIFYNGSRKRVRVMLDQEAEKQFVEMLNEARNIGKMETPPPPLNDSPKCPKCSLVSICLPDETNLFLNQEEIEVRRLFPARTDRFPLYVTKNGCYIGKKGEELDVVQDGKSIARAKIMEVSQVLIYGYSQISTQAIGELLRRNIPVLYFSTGGWFKGITSGMSHKNVILRIKQYETFINEEKSIKIARRMIWGKIRNCRTLLRRNSLKKSPQALSKLKELSDESLNTKDLQKLMGIEGMAARIYFQHFADMLKGDLKLNFEERNRRPPKDPVNAMLSYLYSVLTSNLMVISLSIGLDPYLGFFHRPKYGKPALALDLIEEFRPIVCDSTVLGVINTGEISIEDFITAGSSWALSREGKRKLINAYERRMETLINHPIYGYSVSYRRVMEVQARMLSKVVIGEIENYEPFCTR